MSKQQKHDNITQSDLEKGAGLDSDIVSNVAPCLPRSGDINHTQNHTIIHGHTQYKPP